jgi:hypothetical protein
MDSTNTHLRLTLSFMMLSWLHFYKKGISSIWNLVKIKFKVVYWCCYCWIEKQIWFSLLTWKNHQIEVIEMVSKVMFTFLLKSFFEIFSYIVCVHNISSKCKKHATSIYENHIQSTKKFYEKGLHYELPDYSI